MKSHLRSPKASESTRRRVETCIKRGWRPGLPPVLFYKRTRRKCGRRVA